MMKFNRQSSLRRSYSDYQQETSEAGKTKEDEEFSKNVTEILKNEPKLKHAQEDFEMFLQEVSGDLDVKINQLKNVKNSENTYWNDKTYANIQLLMMNQYVSRIRRFRIVSRNSLETISSSDTKMDARVHKHIETLAKLKRRLKHILDVSNKYAVTDLFDSINLLQDMPEDCMFEVQKVTSKKKHLRKYKSLLSLQKSILNLNKHEPEVNHETEDTIDGPPCKPKIHTLRSLSDHLGVLAKTYTNRR